MKADERFWFVHAVERTTPSTLWSFLVPSDVKPTKEKATDLMAGITVLTDVQGKRVDSTLIERSSIEVLHDATERMDSGPNPRFTIDGTEIG